MRWHPLCSPLFSAVLGVAGVEMDYVLLLKWSGDRDKNTTGRITEIEGGRKPGNWKAGEIKAL